MTRSSVGFVWPLFSTSLRKNLTQSPHCKICLYISTTREIARAVVYYSDGREGSLSWNRGHKSPPLNYNPSQLTSQLCSLRYILIIFFHQQMVSFEWPLPLRFTKVNFYIFLGLLLLDAHLSPPHPKTTFISGFKYVYYIINLP